MAYRSEATSLTGFVQQLACSYLTHGYYHYVEGLVPEHKDPAGVDAKLIERYRIDVSRWHRARRKRAGCANVHYLRFGRHFVLLATDGTHWLREDEAKNLRDVREDPIKVGGYSIRVRQGHSHVRIEEGEFQRLKSYLVDLAVYRQADMLARAFWSAPWEPYAQVRNQLLGVLLEVNTRRKRAGFEPVPASCIRRRRTVVKPFEVEGEGGSDPNLLEAA